MGGKIKHGKSHTKEYHTWEGMKSRCYNTKSDSYKYYMDKGVCDRRLNSFENFLEDMGEAPSVNHSIERVKNELGYSKDNCKWILKKHQTRNRTTSRMIDINGETKCLAEWSEFFNINPNTVYERLKRGWSILETFSVPVTGFYPDRKNLQNLKNNA